MSPARGMSFQKVKSLKYLYKVCIGPNTSRSYCSDRSFKALSFVKKFSTINSAATDESFDLENRNQFTGKTSSALYDKDWYFRVSDSEYDENPDGYSTESDSEYDQNSTGSSTESEYYKFYEGLLDPDEDFKYREHCHDLGEDCLHYQSPNWSYTDMANSQVPSYSRPNVKSDSATIEKLDAFSKEQKLKEASEVLSLLEQNNISVDIRRYLFLMNVHDHLTRLVPCFDVYIYNKILETYLKCCSIDDIYELFIKMPQRNLTSWDTMITWLTKNGHGEDAIDIITEFKSVGLKPDNQMFHGVFAACSIVGDMKEGLLHFESMRKKYNSLLHPWMIM